VSVSPSRCGPSATNVRITTGTGASASLRFDYAQSLADWFKRNPLPDGIGLAGRLVMSLTAAHVLTIVVDANSRIVIVVTKTEISPA
jgi:hypothetical protein